MFLFFNNYYKMIVYNTEIFCVPFIGFPQWCHPQLYSIISLPSIGSDTGRYRTFSSPPESFTSPFYSNFIVIYTHSLLIKCQPPPCSYFCVCHFNTLCINGTIYHASFQDWSNLFQVYEQSIIFYCQRVPYFLLLWMYHILFKHSFSENDMEFSNLEPLWIKLLKLFM